MNEIDPRSAFADLDGDYDPSPIARIRDQVATFEATGGREGNTLEDKPVIILTSIGAKSGRVRKNPLMRIVEGDHYVLVASAAGAADNPTWYGNVLAHPQVRVQDGEAVHELTAREVIGDEKQHWWNVAESFWPHFPEYRQKAGGREIPILVLEP